MKKFWRFIGIAIITAGVCIFLYPIINQAIAKKAQDTLLDEIYAIMEAQNGPMTPTPSPLARMSVTPEPGNNSAPTQEASVETPEAPSLDKIIQPGLLETEFSDLELFEQEPEPTGTVLESERLKGQSLFGIIQIPEIDLIYAVVEGIANQNIGVAIGHFPASVAIGVEGNCALAGHRGGTSGPYFKNVDQLEPRDEIIMTDMTRTEYKYYVTEIFVVEPTDTYVVKDLGVRGRYLTLVTCTDHGTKRLIVRAKMAEE